MISRQRLADLLVRLYPDAWRREYGDELTGVLLAHPITGRIVADVVWNGVRQRARAASPATILGLASMLVVLAGFAVTPHSYVRWAIGVVRPTFMTFPTLTVTFLGSEIYTVLLVVCGYWTARRYNVTPARSGVAAMKMSLLAALPVIVAGALLELGVIDYSLVGLESLRPPPLMMMIAPFARLPYYWMWGLFGGASARRWSSTPTPANAA
jgi:hypothetical protein